jgi:hypothetical protein
MAEIERQYEYKPRWRVILFLGGHAVLVAVVCAYKIAHPWPENLPALYWIVFVLNLVCLTRVAVAAVGRWRLRRRVAFTPTSLLLPEPGWSSDEEAIDYQTITELKVSGSGSGARYLYVTHRDGRRRIAEALLPSGAAFEEVCELLAARVYGPGVRADGRPVIASLRS